jgi:hydroxymethylpyrimidine pyrophosphatase-like HAD family hydrolase
MTSFEEHLQQAKNTDFIKWEDGSYHISERILFKDYLHKQKVLEIIEWIENEICDLSFHENGTNYGTHIIPEAKKRLGL